MKERSPALGIVGRHKPLEVYIDFPVSISSSRRRPHVRRQKSVLTHTARHGQGSCAREKGRLQVNLRIAGNFSRGRDIGGVDAGLEVEVPCAANLPYC